MGSLASPAWAQWTGGPTGPIYYYGNVGIGTTATSQLSLGGYGAIAMTTGNALAYITHQYGATAPNYDQLSIASNFRRTDVNAGTMGTASFPSSEILFSTQGGNSLITFGTGSANGAPPTEVMRITSTGNVGIGITNPGVYKLAVEGTIGARDIIVTNVPWSDYVFRPGYRLRPLSEVKAYIQSHRHLPDIPSEAEVKEKGVSMGDMQAKLLAKVEELTLHMIQAEERSAQLDQQNQTLQRQHEQIRRELDDVKQFRNQERRDR